MSCRSCVTLFYKLCIAVPIINNVLAVYFIFFSPYKAFMLKFVEMGKVLFSLSITQGAPHQQVSHIKAAQSCTYTQNKLKPWK